MACKLDAGFLNVNSRSTFKDLDNGAVTSNLKDLTSTGRAIWQSEIDNFIIAGELDVFENDQRAIDTTDSVVLQTRLDAEAFGNGSLVELD